MVMVPVDVGMMAKLKVTGSSGSDKVFESRGRWCRWRWTDKEGKKMEEGHCSSFPCFIITAAPSQVNLRQGSANNLAAWHLAKRAVAISESGLSHDMT